MMSRASAQPTTPYTSASGSNNEFPFRGYIVTTKKIILFVNLRILRNIAVQYSLIKCRMVPNELRYLPALTGLRAWALTLVVLDHWVEGMHDYGMAGNAGVSLFFVLSGFLISRILLEKKERSRVNQPEAFFTTFLKPFFIRRAWRIFPIYFLTLYALFILGDPVINHQGLPFFTYTANFFLVSYPVAHLDHLWSLSAEEQMYLLTPVLIWFFPIQQLPKLAIMLIFISLFYRGSSYLLFQENTWWPASYCLLPGCLDGYGIGLLVAWYWRYRPNQSKTFFNSSILLNSLFLAWPTVLLAGLLWQMTGQGLFYSPGMAAGLRVTVSLYGGYLIGYLHKPIGTFGRVLLLNPISQYIGRISYGLYLFHNLIYNIHSPQQFGFRLVWIRVAHMLSVDPSNGFIEIGFYSLVTLILASLSWFLLEKPLLDLATKKKDFVLNTIH